jgi:hypothetical protein
VDGGGRYCLICACFSYHTTCFDELKGKMTEYYNDVNSLTASMGTARITACDNTNTNTDNNISSNLRYVKVPSYVNRL